MVFTKSVFEVKYWRQPAFDKLIDIKSKSWEGMKRMAGEKRRKTGAKGIAMNQPYVEAAMNRKVSDGMTQSELARQMGVDRTTLYHMMEGERMSPETVVRLSLFLDEPLENLVADSRDVPKVMKKILTDDINRMDAQEIRALWDLMLPFRTKKKTLSQVLRGSEGEEQHPFKLLMYLLTGDDNQLRKEIGRWIHKSDQEEFFTNRQVVKELYEKVDGLFCKKRERRSA